MTTDEFRAALERLDMTPADAAMALGTTVPTTYRYLKGTRPIPCHTELALANIEKLKALGEEGAATATKTIDIRLTWKGILPMLIAAYVDGSDKGRQIALEELRRMAEAADLYNASAKATKE